MIRPHQFRSPQISGNSTKEAPERVGEPEGAEDTRRIRTPETTEKILYQLTETEPAVIGSIWNCFRSSVYLQLSVYYFYGMPECVKK